MASKGVLFACSLLSVAQAAVTWTATPFNPPSIPLAVRSPYLSAWLHQGEGTALNEGWPAFWTGSILGWVGLVRVDGTSYSFLGGATITGVKQAIQRSLHWTSTQSTFVMTAGPVDLTISFLSPVEPNDLVKHSIPFSYIALSAVANDGTGHSVETYMDISGEWITGDNSLVADWATTMGEIVTHEVKLANQTLYSEANDHIQHGAAYFSSYNTAGLTYQSGSDLKLRNAFVANGKLDNSEDSNYRAVDEDWPVFALAHSLGTVLPATDPLLYSIGHVRDPVIEYIVADGVLQNRSAYFWSTYSSVDAIISDFLGDYSGALSRAKAFDAKVKLDASKISNDYASIVALSIRQAFAATEITISKTSTGNWNTSDVKMFMKEISSNGNMNTVDVIFPAWPLYLYTNPELGRYLLEPLFQYQQTGQYPNKYSIHDLGTHYPRALGHNDGDDEAMPIEESGNMLIMALSYTRASNNTALINDYFNLLDQWAQFLITDSLIPANQLSTDDFAGHLENQTNLAIKGIIGIRAMAEIEGLRGNTAQRDNYTSIAMSYVEKWQRLAIASSGDHLTLAYGNGSSWGLSYNLFADKLLQFNLFPQSIYEMQTTWYQNHVNKYGVPLDTRHDYTKTDWEIWTSAFMTTVAMRDTFISSVKDFAAAGTSIQPFADWYETKDGKANTFRARPVAGGHLALMVLPGSSAVTNNSTPANRSAPDNASLARPFASTSTLIQAAAVAATMLLGVAL